MSFLWRSVCVCVWVHKCVCVCGWALIYAPRYVHIHVLLGWFTCVFGIGFCFIAH